MVMRHITGHVNLLPREVKHSLRIRYYLSLATLFCFLAGVAISLGAALLVPSHLLAKNSVESSTRYQAALEETLGLKGRSGTLEEMATLAERVSILSSYETSGRTAPALAALGRDLPKGISVTKIAIQLTDSGAGTVTVAGIADARADLVALVEALKRDRLFERVAIPVGQLATDTDIPFSLSFALTTP